MGENKDAISKPVETDIGSIEKRIRNSLSKYDWSIMVKKRS